MVSCETMALKEWILILLCANCLSAAPDKYYGYDLIEAKKGGKRSDFLTCFSVRSYDRARATPLLVASCS